MSLPGHRGLAKRVRGAARAVRAAPPPVDPAALRLATVVSHDADGTMTVLLDGGSVSKIRRPGGAWLPPPGGGVWVTGRRPNLWALCSTDDRVGFAPRLDRVTAQSIANNTAVPVTFTAIDPVGNAFAAWAGGAPTVLVVPAKGRYEAAAWVTFDTVNGTVGYRAAQIEADAVIVARVAGPSAGTATSTDVTPVMPARSLAKGALVRLVVRHNSGAALDITKAMLSLTYLGPG